MEYDGSVRPELHPSPWLLSYDGVDPDTAIWVDNGALTVDATGYGAVFFGRQEPLVDLAPWYGMEVRVRRSHLKDPGPSIAERGGCGCKEGGGSIPGGMRPTSDAADVPAPPARRREWVFEMASAVGAPDEHCDLLGNCYLLGAHGVSVVQDRVLTFEVWVLDDPGVGVLVVQGLDEPVELGVVDPSVMGTISISAERGGAVTVSYDGEVRGEFLWDWLPMLDDLMPHPALAPLLAPASSTVVVATFGGIGVHTEWEYVRYEICRPTSESVEVWMETDYSDEPDGRVLRGGTGETLEGLERIHGVLERVDIVHREPGEDEDELITVLEGRIELDILDASAEDGLTRLTGLGIPPGELKQLRLVLSEMNLDLRGESHDVRLPSGAESGIKIVFPGGAPVPEGESLALVVSLDPFSALGRNRAGFWWDPVLVEGVLRRVPGDQPPDPGPWEPPWWWPPGEGIPHEPGPWKPDVCVGPDCPRGPIGPHVPECEDDEVAVWDPPRGFRCELRCISSFLLRRYSRTTHGALTRLHTIGSLRFTRPTAGATSSSRSACPIREPPE